MTDLQVVYDQLAAIVWRDGMPDSAHAQHSANRGYHRHCPICNGQLMRVLEAAAPLFEEGTEARVWRAENTVRGHCRWCSIPVDPRIHGYGMPHRLNCKLYVGPLEHRWQRTGFNGTFGGIDYWCVCGGWFRKGGMAGHGDGSPDAEPVCPHAGEDWRGSRPDQEDHEVVAGSVTAGDLQSVAIATGGDVRSKNFQVEYEDDDD